MTHGPVPPSIDEVLRAERERIARDLHDSVIQDLLAVGLQLTAGVAVEADRTRRDRDAALATQLDRAATRLRQIVGHLQWPDDGAALERELGAILTQSARHLGFAPSLRLAGPLDEIAPGLATHVAAVVQESLSNVARHSGATSVSVTIEVTGSWVEATITDDGRGIADNTQLEGRGLRNLRSRAADCGGHLLLDTNEVGRGLCVTWRGLRDSGAELTPQA